MKKIHESEKDGVYSFAMEITPEHMNAEDLKKELKHYAICKLRVPFKVTLTKRGVELLVEDLLNNGKITKIFIDFADGIAQHDLMFDISKKRTKIGYMERSVIEYVYSTAKEKEAQDAKIESIKRKKERNLKARKRKEAIVNKTVVEPNTKPQPEKEYVVPSNST